MKKFFLFALAIFVLWGLSYKLYDGGYDKGYDEGRGSGYDNGYDDGRTDAFYEGYDEGYDEGYRVGLSDRETLVVYNSFHEQYKNFRSAIARLMYDGEYETVRILLKYNREDVEDALEYEFGVTDLFVIIDYLEG